MQMTHFLPFALECWKEYTKTDVLRLSRRKSIYSIVSDDVLSKNETFHTCGSKLINAG